MARDRQRDKMIANVAIDMMEQGRILTEMEYRRLENPSVHFRDLKRVFGRWPRVLDVLKATSPEVWLELTEMAKPQPKPAVQRPTITPKKVPVPKDKVVPKVAVKKEKDDE